MTCLRTLIVLFVAMTFASLGRAAEATPGSAEEHRGHHPDGGSASTATTESPANAMQEMHDKMMDAMTPEESDALMAEHMKGMPQCMGMRKGMSGMGGRGHPMADMGAMDEPTGMSAEMMSEHHRMMERRMDMMQMMMMQMMMQMLMDRTPPPRAQAMKK